MHGSLTWKDSLMNDYALIPKILPALRRLRRHYENKGDLVLVNIIDSSRVYIEQCTNYDNWNGGTYGHDVFLFVPDEIMDLVDLDEQSSVFARIMDDLNKATPEVENEYVRAVYVKNADDLDPQFQRSINFTGKPQIVPERTGLWKTKSLRIFLSHRDKHKGIAHDLAEALAPFGISSFIAHDAIKPMREWEKEILNALMTMEVMVVLLTDDFHESEWTNQEIGFALGKGVPIICVKVGSIDPCGFIGSKQALKAPYDEISTVAPKIHRALINEIGQEGRLKEILIESFISSPNYVETMERLERLTHTVDRLTDKEFERIKEGYAGNPQLYCCGGIHNRGNWFKRYLESATGKKLEFNDGKIIEIIPSAENELPF